MDPLYQALITDTWAAFNGMITRMEKLQWSVTMHIKNILWVADGAPHQEDRLVVNLPDEVSNFQEFK